MIIKLTLRTALIGLSLSVALGARAQTITPNQVISDVAESVSLEPTIFEIVPITSTLKETLQTGQQLIWLGKEGPNDRRFGATKISVLFLRNKATGEVKMTFAAHVSSLGYRPMDEAKFNTIVRTKSGASIYSWSLGILIRCADKDWPMAPVTHDVPNDIATNVFNNVGTVEIAEYREPNNPRLRARRCQ